MGDRRNASYSQPLAWATLGWYTYICCCFLLPLSILSYLGVKMFRVESPLIFVPHLSKWDFNFLLVTESILFVSFLHKPCLTAFSIDHFFLQFPSPDSYCSTHLGFNFLFLSVSKISVAFCSMISFVTWWEILYQLQVETMMCVIRGDQKGELMLCSLPLHYVFLSSLSRNVCVVHVCINSRKL